MNVTICFQSAPDLNLAGILRTWRRLWQSAILALLLLLPVLASAAPALNGTSPQKIWAQAGQSHWIAQGRGSRVLYVIFDPNCPYCHMLIDELQSQIKPMHLQVRYLVVGFLAPSSAGKAAYILQAKDPLAAILQNEKKFNMKSFGGVPETLASRASEKILRHNLALLRSCGRKVVPTMIYPQKGGKIRIVQGALDASNLHEVLQEIPLHRQPLSGH